MDELLSIIDYIPVQWRGFLALGFLLVPRIIQKIKATDDFKFFGDLPDVLTRAQQQRNQILGKLDTVQYDVALMRKYIKARFNVSEEDMIRAIEKEEKENETGPKQY